MATRRIHTVSVRLELSLSRGSQVATRRIYTVSVRALSHSRALPVATRRIHTVSVRFALSLSRASPVATPRIYTVSVRALSRSRKRHERSSLSAFPRLQTFWWEQLLRDISNYFSGSFTQNKGSKTHAHSNYYAVFLPRISHILLYGAESFLRS